MGLGMGMGMGMVIVVTGGRRCGHGWCCDHIGAQVPRADASVDSCCQDIGQ